MSGRSGGHTVLGIIGARSGSKGLINKNIKPLAGKPLVGWIIETALRSNHLDRVVVSTDAPDYAAIAREHGAETPFLRPKELASDASPEREHIQFALNWLKDNEGYVPDIVVRLLPTSPFQKADDIDGCVDKLRDDPKADTAVVVAAARQHPMKAFALRDDTLVPYCAKASGSMVSNRQEVSPAYFRANVVACYTDVITKTGDMYGDRVVPLVIPQQRAIDIDSSIDFMIAEKLMQDQSDEIFKV